MKWEPFSMKLILNIHAHLDLSKHLDTTVYTCLTMAFYALCCLGELTVKSLKAFDPKKHVKCSNVEMDVKDRHDLLMTKIFRVYWAQQDNHTNPKTALLNHFAINNPTSESHLFTWKHPKGMRPLTQTEFWKRVSGIVKGAHLGNLKGHGLHIGGTLEYLLCGVPFNVVNFMGRWTSEAFTAYLHKHVLILAPYLQPNSYTIV
ncbi:uncharacterized protein F5147DRAFT_746958 [Suillus discolor]|uniref:Uncharacterized protein n=1 Tax=Suillus discolor TaxID=1912936 RepID=A0A9P7F0K0_9AGAM|nr:uncharacterized protein F5147DRAFT_746958 [Suillus discolor]KAG2101607.1 hypothetical protein F5147DRAFT_746958 [Suillus discolor]